MKLHYILLCGFLLLMTGSLHAQTNNNDPNREYEHPFEDDLRQQEGGEYADDRYNDRYRQQDRRNERRDNRRYREEQNRRDREEEKRYRDEEKRYQEEQNRRAKEDEQRAKEERRRQQEDEEYYKEQERQRQYEEREREREQRYQDRQNRKRGRHQRHEHNHNHYQYHVSGHVGHDFKNSIYVHLIPFTYQTFQGSYERITHNSGHRRGLVGSLGFTLSANEAKQQNGFLGELQYRFYFDPIDYSIDLYAGPFAQISTLRVERSGVDELGDDFTAIDEINSYSGGVVGGAKLFFLRQAILEIQVGAGVRSSSIDGDESLYGNRPWEQGYTGVYPRLGVQLGVAF